ncbi:MAG: DNA-binding protein [Gordonia sp.]|uniref:helix-turn-helix domain-containing protein n=1 Tax=Gordonia sp. (in: high G+C Gram-positive bacteria) TaxID=84139 RepID=UPI000C4FD0BA|nr:XRE family transcriptional regulator [Gordonia sp. (in: high G+C Gram-positive bacteria)]MAU81217.1 DNA-binding protein [Gordonia sp. (in: high G+C Gram-positive bacteria)]
MADDEQELTLFQDVDLNARRKVVDAFEPVRLTQARVLAWLTKAELADLVGISAAAIGQFEAGAARPRAELLPVIARRLSVPIEFFAAGRPLGRLDVGNAHFRSLRSTRAKDRAKAAAHAEQVWELTYALEKRVRFPEVSLPNIPDGTTPVDAARVLREAWDLRRGPIPHLAATMESRGIVVCLIPLTNEAVTRVKAYSTDALGRPLVVVTPERFRSVYEYRFTCAHELGHLLLHPNPLPGDRQQEREADQFAAEFLTPRIEIEPLLPKTVRMAKLEDLSKAWGVSIESLIFRMGELRLISDVSIRRAHQRLAGISDFRREEPLAAYPGEVPTLLADALSLAKQHGFDRLDLARELCWTAEHLSEVLGETDSRPTLRIVR